MDRITRIAVVTIGVGLLVLALKTVAWAVTGSAALFSDALESTVNVAASVIALGALRMAARPADANHPYGHEKAEFFAAVIEGALIIAAALTILQHAWISWSTPHTIDQPWVGLALSLGATAINGAWGTRLLREGRRHRSVVLIADALHNLVGRGGIHQATHGVAQDRKAGPQHKQRYAGREYRVDPAEPGLHRQHQPRDNHH